ncbi:hypothetical protein ABZ234_08620 [Nocardiopsis sp. NPDC006198]|uniref:hypothetical protein n=1 Tax=Nocardiopsis sp. NPDC006198 TaxID=3154472 RepID=UPI0033BDE439
MSSPHPYPPLPPQAPSPAPAPRQSRLRGGYIASLISLVATLMVLGILFAFGPWVRQPAPEFITEVTDEPLLIEVDLGEEHLGELGVYGRSGSFGCAVRNPSGTLAEGTRHWASRYTYGDSEWNLDNVLEITETGTHEISCTNRGDAGIATMDVVENAPTRQMLWAITWVSLPTLGLVTTVALAVVTLVRARRQKAAADQLR